MHRVFREQKQQQLVGRKDQQSRRTEQDDSQKRMVESETEIVLPSESRSNRRDPCHVFDEHKSEGACKHGRCVKQASPLVHAEKQGHCDQDIQRVDSAARISDK